jgi:hypothetical protein
MASPNMSGSAFNACISIRAIFGTFFLAVVLFPAYKGQTWRVMALIFPTTYPAISPLWHELR